MSTDEDPVRAHVFIRGRVQGVFYRASTREKALDLGVHGWVRNLDDGRVEAVFEGDVETVEQIVEWCREGSEMAAVDDVTVDYEDPHGLGMFEIKR